RVEVILDLAERPDGDANLGHNYRVVAHIVVWEAEEATAVPLGALFRSAGEWAVFQVIDDRAVLTSVTLGERGRTHAEIRAGLEPGAVVVVHPSDVVTDGSRVTPRLTSG
ncbi:MAG: secretion protein HlyD, partial [Pseudomonadota bacterium]